MNISDLKLFLSGGVANIDPNASVGGEKSSEKIMSQQVVWGGSSSGSDITVAITLLECVGAEAGSDGWFYYYGTSKQAQWRNNNNEGAGPLVSLDGQTEVTLFSATGAYIVIGVDSPNLPASSGGKALTMTNFFNELFDDITKIEAYVGSTDYRCLYVANTHPTDAAIDVRVWVASQPTGADDISIGLGDTTVLENEGIAPVGVVFSSPSDYASGILIGDLPAGGNVAIWVKRTIPSETIIPEPNDIAAIGIGALV